MDKSNKENSNYGLNPYVLPSDGPFIHKILEPFRQVPREEIHFCYLIRVQHELTVYTTLGYTNNPPGTIRRRFLRRAKLPRNVPIRGVVKALVGPFKTRKRCRDFMLNWKQRSANTEVERLKKARELAEHNNVIYWEDRVAT